MFTFSYDLRIAFNQDQLVNVRWAELAIDVIIVLDIIISLNTAYMEDEVLITKRKSIFFKRCKKYLILDILSSVPGIITAETVSRFYYFKVLRFVHIYRLINFIYLIFKRLKREFPESLEKIQNIFTMFK